MTIPELFEKSRKIVVKLGSNTLAKEDGTVNHAFLSTFAGQCAELIEQGKQIVLVSSGAQVAGLSTIDKWARKQDIHYKQALCAIGQVELMDNWRTAFAHFGLHIGQLLLTKEDFKDDYRTLNIRNTLYTLVDESVIPIVNENDSVSYEEIKIGDNDNLSALTAILWSADLLVLVSDIDGIYNKNPKEHKDANLIELVTDIDDLRSNICIGGTNNFGTGGIKTKLEAAEKVNDYGITMILANGSRELFLENLAKGNQKATVFLANR